MTSVFKNLVVMPGLWFILSGAVWAQDAEESGVRTSIGLRAGFGVPVGDWSKSRIAPEVQHFTGGFSYGGDITVRLGKNWGLVFAGGQTILSGSEWEQYAESKGAIVSVSASLTDVSISLRPYLLASPPDLLSLEFGAAGLFADGSEMVDGERYEYDFFSTFRFGFQGALEYDRVISDKVAFTIRSGVVVAPDGMNYADGEARTVVYFPLTAGVRFLF